MEHEGMAAKDNWVMRREAALANWEAKKPRRKGKGCYHAYNLLFLPVALVVLIGLPLSGRTLIWSVDGMSQYYPFFIYEGQWIRGIFQNLFAGNGFAVPLWEWNMGYGADVPTTFDVFLDPLNLISAITPPAISEWVFQLLIVVRMYLAGVAFTYYCSVRGENRTGTVLGALVYALGGSALGVVWWTSGLHALILFPVVLAGAEKVLAGGKPWVFIAALTVLAIVSYYFTYMACILLVGYLALRVVMTSRPHLTVGAFLSWVAKFAGLVALCLMLAGFALVPAVMALMGIDRVTDQTVQVPLLYSLNYYLGLITSFTSTHEVGSDTYVGFGALAFLACVLLFSRRKQDFELKLVLVVLTLFMMLPLVGSLFNGMNYATNRWAWAYTLCVALVLVRMTPSLLQLDARAKRLLAIASAAYAVVLLVPVVRTEANIAGFAALLAMVAVLLVSMDAHLRRALLTGAVALSLAVNGFYFLSADEGGKGSQQVPLATAYGKLTSNSADSMALAVDDPTWWRYDLGQASYYAGSPMNRNRNNGLVLGKAAPSFYNSVYNNAVDRFHTELAIAGDDINFSYTNLQGRSDVMALLGVKYYPQRLDGTDAAPYNYEVAEDAARANVAGVDYAVASAAQALPLAYTFDQALTPAAYQQLPPVQRQQALLQAVVLDREGQRAEGPSANEASSTIYGAPYVQASSLTFEDHEVPYTVAATSGVRVLDNRFIVQAPGSTVTLAFQGTPDADTYVYVQGLSYRDMKPSDFLSDEEEQALPWYRRAYLMANDHSHAAPLFYEISIKSDVSPTTGYLTNETPGNHLYGGKDTWLVGLGYQQAAATSVTLRFDQPGAYSFDQLKVLTETHASFAQWMSDRSRTVLHDAKQGCNELTGTVDLQKPETLLMTVAYSEGWTAMVDGKPVELLRADTGFMALDLPAGYHTIELRYATPGLALGCAISAAGLAILVLLAVVLRVRGAHGKPRRGAHVHRQTLEGGDTT